MALPNIGFARWYNLEICDDKTYSMIVYSEIEYANLENLHNSPQV